MKNILLFFLLIISCKSFNTFQLENDCGNRIIEVSKSKALKGKKKASFMRVEFLNGFKDDKINIIINDTLFVRKNITTDPSTAFAFGFTINNPNDEVIEIYVNDDCFKFILDNNFLFCNIHYLDKVYINYENNFSLSE